MALNPCPECGNMVSSTATSCPKCGYSSIKYHSSNKSKNNIGCFKIGLIILAIIIFVPLIASLFDKKDSYDYNSEINSAIETTVNDNYVEPSKEELALENLQQIEREINFIKKGIDFSPYRGTIANLEKEIKFFEDWAKLIDKANSFDENKTKANELRKLVENVQNKEFPILRKEYVKESANKLWEHDIYVTNTSTNNTTINYTGGIFAANKNIKEFQEGIFDILFKFRFKKVNYRWYKGADEYSTAKIFQGKDSDLL